MKKDTLEKKFMNVLRDGDGAKFWEDEDTEALNTDTECWELFQDPSLSQEIERFIVKNRFAIATSRSRYGLRGLRAKLKTLDTTKPFGGLSPDELSVKI